MDGFSRTPKEERLKALQQLIPEAFTEGKVDWEKLRAALGDDINFANERYVLNWAGKSDAFRIMQQPSSATLVPVKAESVDFDHTRNIFIEGENMEVLKILQKSYFGKVKMIYIDPPYNTGNDSFIYPDRFAETKEEYLRRIGDKTEDGTMTREGLFRKNSRENGQYHSNWLNMMMPRLYLAKSLLRDDGVIFISIDENEIHNLKIMMNEIFGEENYTGEIIWKNSSKNDQAYISIQHEYIISYAKNKSENKGNWIEKKEGLDEIYSAFNKWKKELGNDWDAIHKRALNWYKQFNESNPIYSSKHYSWMDEKGVYFPDNIAGPNHGQYRYDVTHPITGEICKAPASGWRYPESTMKQRIKENLIHFGTDEKTVPNNKTYLKNTENQSLTSVKYKDSRVASNNLENLLGGKYFNNPKDISLLSIIFKAIGLSHEDIILDFFSGSGTTAHTVMQLNKEDGGNRQYICVQLSEPCDENSEAYKAGYKTIADIAKERIRRAGLKIRKEIEAEQEKLNNQLDLANNPAPKMPDLGFKVFRLADSNFKQWRPIAGPDSEAWKQQMIDFINPVSPNATTENMEYELLLKSGKDLNSRIEHKNGYSMVNGKEMALILEQVSSGTIEALLAEKPEKVIALDNLFEGDDQLKTNTALQMKDAGIQFRTI